MTNFKFSKNFQKLPKHFTKTRTNHANPTQSFHCFTIPNSYISKALLLFLKTAEIKLSDFLGIIFENFSKMLRFASNPCLYRNKNPISQKIGPYCPVGVWYSNDWLIILIFADFPNPTDWRIFSGSNSRISRPIYLCIFHKYSNRHKLVEN
jgi:hypothetical protein